MTTPRLVLALLVAAVAVMPEASAQEQQLPLGEWYSLSIGVTTLELVGLSASYNLARRNAYHFSAQHDQWGDAHRHSAARAGIGRRAMHEFVQMAAFVGPSLNYSQQAGAGIDRAHVFAPGAFAGVQFYARPLGALLPEVGIGFELTGDLNAHQSYYGIRLALMFGNAR